MKQAWKWLTALLTTISLLLSAAGQPGDAGALGARCAQTGLVKSERALRKERGRSLRASASPAAALLSDAAADAPTPEPVTTVMESEAALSRETTIPGGISVKNATSYPVDAEAILSAGCSLRLSAEGPQILILHTHGSEAYTPAGLDRYESDDAYRTEDERCNVVRVGDELQRVFEEAGLRVLHDRSLYDSPSYAGSYSRSGEAVERYLAEYPGISVVIDLHRDALGSGDVVYKTMAEEAGTVASQVMLLVGTDESGLPHPNWNRNLSLALYLQAAAVRAHPTLMRPVSLVPQRYNQQLCPGSLLLEVGSSGNTLQEALAAARLFGAAAAEALLALAEEPPEGT